jgi:methylenetetrahydrofolate reductase (NADPH)
MEKKLHSVNIDLPGADENNAPNGTRGTNGTNGETKEAYGEEKQNPGLLATAKAAAVEVTNGMKSMTVSN